ncbi:glycosyltransferase family 39 protein [bacterium]|nr:glycosyltransferase family 39 protein [bacterium]
MATGTIDFKKLWQEWNVIILMVFLKLAIHVASNTNYGFHRDEFLYLAEGEHLAWGYMEVPPAIASLAKIALSLGGSLFVVRLLPTLVGVVTVFLIGLTVRELGGKKWAQAIACLAYILSPAFMRSNMLFQPVTFNQFCWFLSAFLIVRLIKSQNPKYWFYLGITAGIGFLTKYSIVFFYAAFLIAIFLTPERKWLKTRYPYLALGIALLIALPNLIWQFKHNWPVVQHMAELSRTQLTHVEPLGFLGAQLRFHHASTLVWLTGLLFLLSRRISAYRIIAWTYLLVVLVLLLLSGKSYYALGAYPILMVIGGIALEDFLKNKSPRLKYVLIVLLVLATLPIAPYGLPVLKVEEMKRYCAFMEDRFGLSGPLRWEDGQIYSLPQDFADMHGWEEMAAKVGKLYHSLPPEERQTCMIFGGSYSHAAPINYYREKYNLPEVYSFVGSFLIWTPDEANFDRQIMIDDVRHTESRWFAHMEMVDQIRDPHAREPGYIYYRTNPKVDLPATWAKLVADRKQAHNL